MKKKQFRDLIEKLDFDKHEKRLPQLQGLD